MRLREKKTEKKKSQFEASLPMDNPDVKVVAASYKGKPFLVGVGTSEQRQVKGSGQAGLKEGVKGEYQSQKDLNWQLFYNLGALPTGFIPAEKLKDFMASTVSVVSGSATVYSKGTKFVETDPIEWKKIVEAKDEKTIRKIGEGSLGEVNKVEKAGQETLYKVTKKKKEQPKS